MADYVVETEGKQAWITYTHNRIKNNKNALYFISGQTGSGKSWSAISICKQLDPDFDESRIVFSGSELLNLVNNGNLKKGSCILFDEAGIDLGNRTWQSLTNRVINYLLQTFRHKNFILIFTSPYMDFVDAATRKLFHAQFEVLGIDKEAKKTKLRCKLIEYNGNYSKFYYKYLRIMIKAKRSYLTPIKLWNVAKPEEELVNNYESKKNVFTLALNQQIEKDLAKKNSQKEKKKKKEYDMKCPKCNYEWKSYLKQPKRCPKCSKRLISLGN